VQQSPAVLIVLSSCGQSRGRRCAAAWGRRTRTRADLASEPYWSVRVMPRSTWPFFEALRRLGFIEGQNLAVDTDDYGLSTERIAAHAAALVKERVDVILAGGDEAVRLAQLATTSIPVLAFTDDMVGQGFVRSLAKPGGDTTGITILASELDGKRQEILMELIPGHQRIAVLADSNTTKTPQLRELESVWWLLSERTAR
jgi:ABC transporter substrate binding protein